MDCLKKRGLDVRQVWIMVHERSILRGFMRRNAWDVARGMKGLDKMIDEGVC